MRVLWGFSFLSIIICCDEGVWEVPYACFRCHSQNGAGG